MANPSNSLPPNSIKHRTVGDIPAPRALPRRVRRPLFPGEKPPPAGRPVVAWYLRLLDPRIYLRLGITVVVLGAVAGMLLISRQHLQQQLAAQPVLVEGLVRPGQAAGEALSLDNLEDSLIGLYLRVQQPALAASAGDNDQVVPFTIRFGRDRHGRCRASTGDGSD